MIGLGGICKGAEGNVSPEEVVPMQAVTLGLWEGHLESGWSVLPTVGSPTVLRFIFGLSLN